jgi:hypothetical protein
MKARQSNSFKLKSPTPTAQTENCSKTYVAVIRRTLELSRCYCGNKHSASSIKEDLLRIHVPAPRDSLVKIEVDQEIAHPELLLVLLRDQGHIQSNSLAFLLIVRQHFIYSVGCYIHNNTHNKRQSPCVYQSVSCMDVEQPSVGP